MRYRHFRNTDPPAVAALWNEALTHRGAVELRSHTPLENAVFNKPYFDPLGFVVVEDDDGRMAAFAHAGFGPNEDLSALDRRQGVICAIAVRPNFRRRGIGSELLRRCEAYLEGLGTTNIQAGPTRPNKPFYLGVYGGSNAPGFLGSDPDIEPFLLANGYQSDRRVLVFDRRLDVALNIVDARFGPLKRKYETQALPQARLGSWWRECVLGSLEPSEFRLDDKATGQTAARAMYWEMTDYGWRWARRRRAFSTCKCETTCAGKGLENSSSCKCFATFKSNTSPSPKSKFPRRTRRRHGCFVRLGSCRSIRA